MTPTVELTPWFIFYVQISTAAWLVLLLWVVLRGVKWVIDNGGWKLTAKMVWSELKLRTPFIRPWHGVLYNQWRFWRDYSEYVTFWGRVAPLDAGSKVMDDLWTTRSSSSIYMLRNNGTSNYPSKEVRYQSDLVPLRNDPVWEDLVAKMDKADWVSGLPETRPEATAGNPGNLVFNVRSNAGNGLRIIREQPHNLDAGALVDAMVAAYPNQPADPVGDGVALQVAAHPNWPPVQEDPH